MRPMGDLPFDDRSSEPAAFLDHLPERQPAEGPALAELEELPDRLLDIRLLGGRRHEHGHGPSVPGDRDALAHRATRSRSWGKCVLASKELTVVIAPPVQSVDPTRLA